MMRKQSLPPSFNSRSEHHKIRQFLHFHLIQLSNQRKETDTTSDEFMPTASKLSTFTKHPKSRNKLSDTFIQSA